MTKVRLKFVTCLLLLLFLVGCSTTSKPNDVREELYNNAVKFYNMIDERNSNNQVLDVQEDDMFRNFVNHSKTLDLSQTEEQIIVGLLNMGSSSLDINIANIKKDKEREEKAIVRYNQEKQKLKTLLNI